MAAIAGASATVAARTTSRDGMSLVLHTTSLGHCCDVVYHFHPLPRLYSTLVNSLFLGGVFVETSCQELTTTSYAILGLLTIKPWSTYELAKQMQRDRFVWPRAESNLYAEPKKLIAYGYASTHPEPRGKRRRTVYTITPSGKQALTDWLQTPAAEPRWEAESMVKFHFATGSTKEQLLANVHEFRQHATARWKAVAEIFRPYVEGNVLFPRPHPPQRHPRKTPPRDRTPPSRMGRPDDRRDPKMGHNHGTPRPHLNARRTKSRNRRWQPPNQPRAPVRSENQGGRRGEPDQLRRPSATANDRPREPTRRASVPPTTARSLQRNTPKLRRQEVRNHEHRDPPGRHRSPPMCGRTRSEIMPAKADNANRGIRCGAGRSPSRVLPGVRGAHLPAGHPAR